MTSDGVKELYMWLTAAWPTVVRPGASDDFKLSMMKTLYREFQPYEDEDVIQAYRTWTANNERYPSIRNIINEIRIEKQRTQRYTPDRTKKYTVERIDREGIETAIGYGDKTEFTWEEFMDLPCNPDHLTPLEWERRFMIRRKEIISKLQRENGKDRPLTRAEEQARDALLAKIREIREARRNGTN